MNRLYALSDDYYEQEDRFKAAFSKLRKEFHRHLLSLEAEMTDALEGKHE